MIAMTEAATTISRSRDAPMTQSRRCPFKSYTQNCELLFMPTDCRYVLNRTISEPVASGDKVKSGTELTTFEALIQMGPARKPTLMSRVIVTPNMQAPENRWKELRRRGGSTASGWPLSASGHTNFRRRCSHNVAPSCACA